MEYRCLHDRSQIERFLRRDPHLHLYSLGDLDDFFWPYTLWYGHGEGGALDAVALLYAGMEVPTLLALSRDREPMSALVRSIRHLLPPRFYAHLSPGLAPALEPAYELVTHGLHLKMALDPAGLPGAPDSPDGVVRLGSADLPALLEFYAEAYPGNWFDPRMVETGRYYGIREGGRLASVAGIHVYAPELGAAALGNIATLPSRRGSGYGTRVTAHLCRSLLADGCAVGLNVKADNGAAIACYRSLGFRAVAEYEEWTAGIRRPR